MTAEGIAANRASLLAIDRAADGAARFRFGLATPEDNRELLQFSLDAAMPGAIRFSFDRTPDYLAALCVEGRHFEVLVCRESQTKRLVATGHRSIKPTFVDGEAAALGYLSGLRVDPTARSGQLLARGYAFLRALHACGPARFYLTTVMEENRRAKEVLLSGRLGLPTYYDLGRFCCVAASLAGHNRVCSNSDVCVRPATAADGPAVVQFLNREGHSRQFFPEYRLEDFGQPSGLLACLEWKDVFLAVRGNDLVGVLAAWDQRALRRWRVTGYAPWLRFLRGPLNLVAGLRGMPRLPRPDCTLDYFVLSLICIRQNDCGVFHALLENILREKWIQYAFFLAGLHERDPLLSALLARPHVPLPSRLYAVAWEDGAKAVQKLDRQRVPYLELGAL
jgi:hypothetical protein